jgi:hypothetical protein
VIALVYVDRIGNSDPDTAINKLAFQQLLLACMVVAVKFHDDNYCCNEHYASVGCVQPSELVALERQLVHALDWKLYVGLSEYERYSDGLFSEA